MNENNKEILPIWSLQTPKNKQGDVLKIEGNLMRETKKKKQTQFSTLQNIHKHFDWFQ